MKNKQTTRRKLQFAGNSSYVLTLPKKWIISQNLDTNNSEVLIEELSDSTIRITPSDNYKNKELNEKYIIKVDKNSDPEEIVRMILGAYLASYNQIEITTKKSTKIIPIKVSIATEEIIGKLWGSEIIAQTSDTIVIQDALDPSLMKLKECIEKAWFTAKNMLEQSFKAIFNQDKNAMKIVINSENTLDKLYYLALRQLYKASSNYLFASNIGIRTSEIIDYHHLAKNIERIGDHCVQLVENFGNKMINKDHLENLSSKVIETTDTAIEAFKKLDEELAQEAIKQKINIHLIAEENDIAYQDYPIARSILRMADYSADIGELVINRKVATDSKKL